MTLQAPWQPQNRERQTTLWLYESLASMTADSTMCTLQKLYPYSIQDHPKKKGYSFPYPLC